eukprot:CAMPEP_0116997540 /NCGR_PEP_ID=MMETSP0472-20121206/945_1 /TAXON_ID=693140 ORGANISM="Tiarina fusus, Strain LIS" /NCGR_SAMPLE_ID=MMETSP0472 /ASSEMBLY_ACC=CAM_ASM_000603 /LENGTH=39 /DNA_ID= /DNA_START= /DNA_END= /DNA_ORIENTATION=
MLSSLDEAQAKEKAQNAELSNHILGAPLIDIFLQVVART